MARTAKPNVQKCKDWILALTHEETEELADWFEAVQEVRAADAEAAKRRAATRQAIDSKSTTPIPVPAPTLSSPMKDGLTEGGK